MNKSYNGELVTSGRAWEIFSIENLYIIESGVRVVEKWAFIPGYEKKYKASTFGRIKSIKRSVNIGNGKRDHPEIIMKQAKTNMGHLTIQLPFKYATKKRRYKKFLVHRLVAFCFIDNPSKKPHINHKDGVKTNNNFINLEWCTVSENALHAVRTGLCKPLKLPRMTRPLICYKTGKIYDSIKAAIPYSGFSASTLYHMMSGDKKNKTTLSYLTEKIIQNDG